MKTLPHKLTLTCQELHLPSLLSLITSLLLPPSFPASSKSTSADEKEKEKRKWGKKGGCQSQGGRESVYWQTDRSKYCIWKSCKIWQCNIFSRVWLSIYLAQIGTPKKGKEKKKLCKQQQSRLLNRHHRGAAKAHPAGCLPRRARHRQTDSFAGSRASLCSDGLCLCVFI